MKKLFLPFLTLSLAVFLNSCSNNEDTMSEDISKNIAQSYDVYVAGRENNKACYWKNNVKTDLTNGDNLIPLDITVQNNNVYVTGSNGSTPTTLKPIHYFWKNGTRNEIKQYLNLPNSGLSGITSFTVNNGDIYFAGYVENPTATSAFEQYELCYWKNGVKTILYKSQYVPSAEGIEITNSATGSDVYVSAMIADNNQNVDRGYFKNTTFNSLNQPSFVFNFAKNTNGLHILFQKNSKYYSKNIFTNVETLIGNYTLPIPFYGKITTDTETNDLYTMYYNQGNNYYKNTTTVNPSFSSLPYIQDLFALDNKIYMVKYDTPNSTYTGKVFVNGVESQSITSTQNSSQNYTGTFNAIYVVKN